MSDGENEQPLERMIRPDEIEELEGTEQRLRVGETVVVETADGGRAVQRVMRKAYKPVREHIVAHGGDNPEMDGYVVQTTMDHSNWRDKVPWAEQDARRMGFYDKGDSVFFVIHKSGTRKVDGDVIVSMVSPEKVRVSSRVNDNEDEAEAKGRVGMVAGWVLEAPDKLGYTGLSED